MSSLMMTKYPTFCYPHSTVDKIQHWKHFKINAAALRKSISCRQKRNISDNFSQQKPKYQKQTNYTVDHLQTEHFQTLSIH